jgi:D-alanyl-D-alanine carboxypeptidase (penicillin-binding protein 5/6)
MRSLIGGCLLFHATMAAALPDLFPDVATAYRVEINGTPTWERQPHAHLPIASLTKLMAALLTVEQGNLDLVTRISPAAAAETGLRLELKTGEQYPLHELLTATLMASANDACHALADAVAGSERAFVQRMNRRAAELGMHDTHFTDACGHDSRGQHSSANDLALLAQEVIKHPQLSTVTSRRGARIRTADHARTIVLANRNVLIDRQRGTFSLKTGYTARAGKCLIAYARRADTSVLLILLHGNDRWRDASDIMDISFEQARDSPRNKKAGASPRP